MADFIPCDQLVQKAHYLTEREELDWGKTVSNPAQEFCFTCLPLSTQTLQNITHTPYLGPTREEGAGVHSTAVQAPSGMSVGSFPEQRLVIEPR